MFGVDRSLGLGEKIFDCRDFFFLLMHLDALSDAGTTEVLARTIGGEVRFDSIA